MRFTFPRFLFLSFIVAFAGFGSFAHAAPGSGLNVILITADDLNYDSPGFAGAKVAGVTPNLDRLAREGMRFVNAHVTVAVCQPSRETLMTGRYPHRSGATGFYPVRDDVTTLMETLKSAGYRIGILGKVTHLKPDEKFPWDFKYDQPQLGAGRDPALYGRYTTEFLATAKSSKKPFFLMVNSHDPHRPWAGSETERNQIANPGKNKKGVPKKKADDGDGISGGHYPAPSRTYRPEEITVPGFLPDIPGVRAEMAEYWSSVRRCDDTIGAVLRAIKDAGQEDTTLVMFLSDNGISQPFAKSNCYLTSTRTPWLARWPGQVKPGTTDATHFISSIDFMPTILEATGVAAPAGMDGRSFLPLLTGATQPDRDRVFTCYNDTSGKRGFPMRCLQTKTLGYIFNAWSDGKTHYQSEPLGGKSFAAMKAAAPNDPAIAKRVDMLLLRTPEELYDFAADPNALNNLANDPKYRGELLRMRAEMREWMKRTEDPLLAKLPPSAE